MIRALIPFAEEACTRFLNGGDDVHKTIIEAAKQMHNCYKCLRTDCATWKTDLPEAARLFVNNYVALHEASDGKRWRPKPKCHYFLELCSEGTKPELVWTYRDEDFGGGWSLMARSRGGKRSPTAQSARAINNWTTSQPVPRIRLQ